MDTEDPDNEENDQERDVDERVGEDIPTGLVCH